MDRNQSSSDRFLDQARETRPWPERRAERETRFLAICRRAWDHSPAYRRLWATHGPGIDRIKSLDDLALLPLFRLTDLVDAQKESPPLGGFETRPAGEFRRLYVNPGLIWQPGEPEYADTSWAEGLAAAGLGPGDLILNTFNYHLWPYAFMLDDSARMVGATVVPTGVGNTLMQVRIMQLLKVNAFMGTPSFLNTLIQRAEALGISVTADLELKKAVVGAEMLPESLRSRLEEKYGLTIRQLYGTVFLGGLGYECRFKTGLHVPENIIVEVVDPQTGRPVPEGAAGEIVATNFNRDYPMIRLATGDLSFFRSMACPCGRTGPMLGRVLGRVDQATKVRGTFVHPWQTDEVMARFPEVFKYQVLITRENDVDLMTFRVEPVAEGVDQGRLAARIEREIKDLLTIKGVVQVVPRGSIPDFHRKIEDRRQWE